MVNEKYLKYGIERSAIRELFEYGKKQAKIVGTENVFDFSLGNPSTPAPNAVNETICKLLSSSKPIHGYTSAPGSITARTAIANSITARFGVLCDANDIYITCGAAAALCSVFGALTKNKNTEFVAIAPYFPEYKVFAETSGGHLKVVSLDEQEFQINFENLNEIINKNTAAVILNSPNNPSGRVYTKEILVKLANLLKEKETEFGHPIYIISDEPYRELVYDNTEVPYIPSIYNNTVVCYSYSKSLSLPGERIGYVFVPSFAENAKNLYAAVAGAARAMGYVCAPSLLQEVIADCIDVAPNLSDYKINRELLYTALCEYGYECVKPDGAFYLFVKAPFGNGNSFSDLAKEKNILIVPGESFGAKDYVRISYCVDTEMIKRALPYFKELIEC